MNLNSLFGPDLRVLFPEVTKTELTFSNQIYKVLEELTEAEEAQVNGDREHFLHEMVDVIQASFTTIYRYGYSDNEIHNMIDVVVAKNRARGYYD